MTLLLLLLARNLLALDFVFDGRRLKPSSRHLGQCTRTNEARSRRALRGSQPKAGGGRYETRPKISSTDLAATVVPTAHPSSSSRPPTTTTRPSMATPRRHPLVSLCLLLVFAAAANALHFYLDTNEKRCFIEELPTDTVVEGACYVAVRHVRSRAHALVRPCRTLQSPRVVRIRAEVCRELQPRHSGRS